jgi:hypothetical protein
MTTAANPFNSLAAVHKAAKQSDPLFTTGTTVRSISNANYN